MYTTTQILTPNIQISYNWHNYTKSETLFMFMKVINDYEPGIYQIIAEMSGVYKNKDPKDPKNPVIYNYLKYKYTLPLSFCSQENILLRKIDEHIIKVWTIYIHHKNPSIIEAIYQNTPFKKKRNKKWKNKKWKNKKRKTIPCKSIRIRTASVKAFENCGHHQHRTHCNVWRQCYHCMEYGANYCSPECQQKDWKQHKKECDWQSVCFACAN